jgi:DNA-directed RNA polymerase subunit RPC12/RpoP
MSFSEFRVGPTARCAGCAQVWLVPGLQAGEKYACKGCGQLILVSGREPSPPPVAARSMSTAEGAPHYKGREDGR